MVDEHGASPGALRRLRERTERTRRNARAMDDARRHGRAITCAIAGAALLVAALLAWWALR